MEGLWLATESQEMASSMMPVAVMTRLDRLDHMVKLLEEKHGCSGTLMNQVEDKSEHKTLSSALEEIQHKGTLIERVTLLESRVLQLIWEMEEGSMWNSSSSRVQTDQMAGEEAGRERENEDQATVNLKGNQADKERNEMKGERKPGYESTRLSKKGRKKWLRLFQIRC